MNPDRIAMSQRDREPLTVLRPVLDGPRSQAEAARLLGKSTRQVRRLLARLKDEGEAGLDPQAPRSPLESKNENNNKMQYSLVLRGASPGLRPPARRGNPRRSGPAGRPRDPQAMAHGRGALAAGPATRHPPHSTPATRLLRRVDPARRLDPRVDRGTRRGHGPLGHDRRRHRPRPGPLRPGRDPRPRPPQRYRKPPDHEVSRFRLRGGVTAGSLSWPRRQRRQLLMPIVVFQDEDSRRGRQRHAGLDGLDPDREPEGAGRRPAAAPPQGPDRPGTGQTAAFDSGSGVGAGVRPSAIRRTTT